MKDMPKQSVIKVMIIVDGLPAGGVERQIVELLRGVKQVRDIETTLCVLSTGGTREKEANGWSDTLLSISGAGDAGLSLLLKFPFLTTEILFKFRHVSPDIIHTYGCFSDILGAVLSRFFKVPFINGSIRAARPVLNHRDRLSKLTFPYAKKIVGNSEAGLSSFGRIGNSIVIHNGVDMDRFLGVSAANVTGYPVLCMVGNFTNKKDQNSIIYCLPELKKQFKNIKLLLIGRGKSILDSMTYAAKLGCSEQVCFIENCDNPESYITASDICLLMSNIKTHGEGISNAIIEYMALGKPVIASDCGGNRELLIDGETGYLVSNNDQSSLTSMIKALVLDPVCCRKMGDTGRKRIIDNFSLTKMVDSYVILYKNLVIETRSKKHLISAK